MNKKEFKPTDKVVIKGIVTVYQEDPETGERIYLVKDKENHWVDAGLKGLVSALIGKKIDQSKVWSEDFKMYLGTDTDTTTTHNLTALVSPIGSAPGTPPDHTSGCDISNPSTGVWETCFIAIWYAGSVSGTVGELALYLRAFDNLTPGWSESYSDKSLVMVSRLSVADGDFSAFTIDTSKSLTVEWKIRIEFA